MERAKLAELYTQNNLQESDMFSLKMGGKSIPIIKREGIERIQAHNKIKITYDLVWFSDDHKYAIVKAFAIMGEQTIETFGEVSPANSSNKYPIAIAEKRALSRAVLKLAGFYAEGAFGEDEADEFKPEKK